jgi:hypothetical protein
MHAELTGKAYAGGVNPCGLLLLPIGKLKMALRSVAAFSTGQPGLPRASRINSTEITDLWSEQ